MDLGLGPLGQLLKQVQKRCIGTRQLRRGSVWHERAIVIEEQQQVFGFL
jgi:hypothetical protein